jgi:hypothetical protein
VIETPTLADSPEQATACISPVVPRHEIRAVMGPADRRRVFAAFERPEQFARWWPEGFRNTFERFEFAPGGRWVFTLTVTLAARGDRTHLTWVQEFESPETAARLRPVCEPANEQNLDRLRSLLADEST